MYVSLHNRSAYSFGSSLIRPAELAEAAARHGMPAVALTDLHGLYAAVEFHEACRRAGVRPVFGAEMHLAEGPGVVLLVENARGYANLCRLVSRYHLGGRPIGLADLEAGAEGLICLLDAVPVGREPPGDAGGAGRPGQERIREGIYRRRRETLEPLLVGLRRMFGGALYVALSLHRPEDAPEARRLACVADEHGVSVAATCRARCLRADQTSALRALASIGSLTLLDAPHPDKPEGAWHFRPPQEMRHLFRRRPDALENTLRIARRCDFAPDLGRNRFPAFVSPDGRSAAEHLRDLCLAGLRRRYVEGSPPRGLEARRPTPGEALARLERELAVIEQVGYAEYFLVFHEIVEYCRGRGIAVLARGSAADSLVCYVLGVSHACPFRFDLPFDRFLNAERAKFSKMADIDLDLPWHRRDEVVRRVYDRWSHDRVAMIGAPNCFHARAAVADLARVFGLPPHEIRRVTRGLPRTEAGDLARAVAGSPEARGFPIEQEPYRTIARTAAWLEGLPRHWSMHPCGLVVSPEPLTGLVPVQPSARGLLTAQYDMEAIERLGFIKIDLLGQAGLSVLRDAVEEIERTEGVAVRLEADVDYRDAATWELIATGGARGVHHIESPAMTSLLRQCDCRDIDCLTAVVAIIRPGAANQGKKDAFARRHLGLEPPSLVDPSLEPVLAGTYGLMVFEEHILQVAAEFAGMNIGRADTLRRALSRQDRRLLAELGAEFRSCARARGRSEAQIEAVWKQLEGFSGFMFNKAHSAEYAVEAFQGAWLKRRRPAHYLAAVLSNGRGFYAHSPTLPQILYVLEARRLGIGFLPPCVNRSRRRFSVEAVSVPGGEIRTMIRVPPAQIAGLSEAFLQRWWSRRERGPFESMADFVARCEPGEAEALRLLEAGALDVFAAGRPECFWELRRLLRRGGSGQRGLWEAAGARHGGPECPPLALTGPDGRAVARREAELLGFPITIDPLTFLGTDEKGRAIDWSAYVPVARLGEHAGRRVTVCGLMVADRINPTTGGDLMKFVTLADRSGFVETFMFPDTYARFGHLTAAHPILEVAGRVEAFENRRGFTLRAEHIRPPWRARSAVGCPG